MKGKFEFSAEVAVIADYDEKGDSDNIEIKWTMSHSPLSTSKFTKKDVFTEALLFALAGHINNQDHMGIKPKPEHTRYVFSRLGEFLEGFQKMEWKSV